MRVLHLLKTSTGASWAYRQMRELVKLGVEVYVAMPANGVLVSKYIEIGVKILYIDYSLAHPIKTCKELRKIVSSVNPDIIHSHFVLTTLFMRLALRDDDRHRIFQVPGPLHLESWFFRNAELLLKQNNDYWVGSCLWTNERYKRSGISDDRIFLSYYGTDIHKEKDYISGKLKKEMLGLKEEDILIGIVAYMYAPKRYLGQKRGLKGHEDLIDAIAILKHKYPNLYCVCIGGAWDGAIQYEESIKRYAAEKAPDRILFTGTIANVSQIYNDLFCVVHPSHSENLGGAAESLLLGVPTISSNVGGFPDIVINEETGLLVPAKNPQAIADALNRMLCGECDIDAMVTNGLKRTRDLMDINNTAKSIFNVYKQLMLKQ